MPTDPNSIQIRSAVESDIPTIFRLIRELAEYEKLLDQVVADERTLRRLLFGERRYAETLLAEVHGEAVGFALFFHNVSTFLGRSGLYLEDLFVRPAFRGQGIGKALLTQVARLAVERECGRMEWAVLNWNCSAIEFYESLGAKPQSEWTTYRLSGEALLKAGRAAD